MKRVCLYVGILLPLVGCEPEPTNYEDCVLQKIGDVDREAAQLLHAACRSKFSRATTQSSDVASPGRERMTIEEAVNLPAD